VFSGRSLVFIGTKADSAVRSAASSSQTSTESLVETKQIFLFKLSPKSKQRADDDEAFLKKRLEVDLGLAPEGVQYLMKNRIEIHAPENEHAKEIEYEDNLNKDDARATLRLEIVDRWKEFHERLDSKIFQSKYKT